MSFNAVSQRLQPRRFIAFLTAAARKMSTDFNSIRYQVADRVATITLNRPERANAIDEYMPFEIESAVQLANFDESVRVIRLTGSGKFFCAGYDLKKYAEGERGSVHGSQKMPWDPYVDYQWMHKATEAYMSLWRSLKPTVVEINGDCIAGGSDIALCCDVSFIADDALIGYPPARIWGCPTGAMWYYRLGLEKAKRMLLTGALVSGEKAVEMGLIGECAPRDQLSSVVDDFVAKMVDIPTNQLWMQKTVINNAVEMQGLFNTQRLAVLFDGMSRHTPEGVAFQKEAESHGFKAAIAKLRGKIGSKL
uniref:Enoyl-CoA hydratase n=1 Tax=Plectus sambesii TaxID=2011161 RepID=A0A914VNN3_9BILA